jgi:hypothetical protein
MANRLLVNGTGYTLTDTAPPSGYNSMRVCGRYLWGRTTRDSNSGGFYFIKGGTKYYACLYPVPSGSVSLSSGSSWTVPNGVNRVYCDITNTYYTCSAGGVFKITQSDSFSIFSYNETQLNKTHTKYTYVLQYGPSINT